MRIAYLITDYPAVPHTFIAREIRALEQRGTTVLPVTLNRAPEHQILSDHDRAEAARTHVLKSLGPTTAAALAATVLRHPAATVRGVGRALRGTGGAPGRIGKQLLQFVEALLLWRFCRRQDCTSVHAHFGQVPATVAWFTAAFANDARPHGPRFTWSVTVHGWHEFVNQDLARLAEKVEAADGVVCISNFTRAQLMRIADPAAWSKLEVVRCGLALDEFPYRTPPEVPRDRRPVVVITARLSPEKGHLVLIEAVAALRRAGTEVSVRCIGSGPFESGLRDAAARQGVADLVEFVGSLPPAQVSAELRDADAFCLPTFAEGLPVSIMEAMAVGVPVVTTYISGIPELVVDGRTGWIVPAGDDRALASALQDALWGPTRTAVVDEARRAVAAAHDIETNVVALERVLAAAHGG